MHKNKHANQPCVKQTDAPSAEIDGNDEDAWHFLGDPDASLMQSGISRVLKELAKPVTAADFQLTTDLETLFQSATGWIAAPARSINPFFRRVAVAVTFPKMCGKLKRLECEKLLRDVSLHELDSIHAVIVLLSLDNEQVKTLIKRAIVCSFENNEAIWNCWREFSNYSGDMAIVDRTAARDCYTQFWRIADELFNNCVEQFKTLFDETDESHGVEILLKRWRDVSAYFKETSWEDVFLRERILFNAIPFKMEWSIRYKHLMKVLYRDEMNIPQSVIDIKLIDLDSSENYEEWIQHTRLLLKLASMKGILFRKTHSPMVATVTAVKTPKTGSCFKCGEKSHWANECPQNVTRTEKRVLSTDDSKGTRDNTIRHPVERSPAPGVSRFGRTIKSAKPVSLHTKMVDDRCEHGSILTSNCAMPSVRVIVEGVGDATTFNGLIDTGSNLCYIGQGAFTKLRDCYREPCPTFNIPNSLAVQTMNGCRRGMYRKGTELNISIEDSSGERSAFKCKRIIVYDGEVIPGGYDFLLSADFVLDNSLRISGVGDGYEISLPRASLLDKSTTTEETGLSLFSIQFDAPEIDDSEDFELETAESVIRSGPLSEDDLDLIKSRIYDPPLKLLFDPAKIDPPVREYGFPAPLARQEKLFELLDKMEEQNIVRQVPRGTGLYVSPGYAVKKSADRVRIVVKYCSLNDRLIPPAGVRHHSPVEWMHNLPSWGRFYSVLDVKDAFYRVDVDPESRPYLNMSVWSPTGCREYEWLKMPQGLSPSPSYWCSLIESTVSSLIRFLNDHPDFSDLLSKARILVYVDDILIAASDEKTCAKLTDITYQVLTFNKMYLPESKIQRCKESVEIMGLKLWKGCIYPNATTVDKVKNLKKPKDKNELLAVLGLLNYVRRALPTQSNPTETKIGRLYDLTSRGRFSWDDSHDEALEELVTKFNEGLPVACFSLEPNVEDVKRWTLVIQCDASLEYLGFVTMLIPKVSPELMDDATSIDVTAYQDSLRIINMGTKRLQHAERLYVPHDREALGIFWALESNRALIYLFGEVVLQTDNRTALSRYSKISADEASTTRGRRWIRWLSDLADLLFCKSEGGRIGMVRFCHVKGKANCFADYLSRYVLDDLKICEIGIQTEDPDVPALTLTTVASYPSLPTDEFRMLLSKWELDSTSQYIKKIKLQDIHQVLSGECGNITPSRKRVIDEICVRRFSLLPDGCLLFHNNKDPVLVVPNVNMDDSGLPLRVKLIQLYHEESALSCHRAELGTRAMLRKTYWWPSMDKDVSLWIASCIPCITRKGMRFCGTFNPRKIQAPNQLLVCDWMGPLRPSVAGYQYVLVLVDAFSSFSIAIPYRHKSSENVADAILNWISLFGCPERWASDNDTSFISETVSTLRSLLGMKTDVAPTYSPTTQGAVERVVRTLKEGIEISLDANSTDTESPIDWPSLLKACIFNSNSIERHGGISPFEIMLGRKPIDPFLSLFGAADTLTSDSTDEYVTKLRQQLMTIHEYWRSKSMEIKNKAADNQCSGIFDDLKINDLCVRVSYISGRRIPHGTVRIVSKTGTNTFRVKTSNGKTVPCHGYQLLKVEFHPNRDPRIDYDIDNDEYFEIERIIRYDPEMGYLVKWVDFPPSENSWQLAADMPPSFRRQMATARKRYHETQRSHLGGSVESEA